MNRIRKHLHLYFFISEVVVILLHTSNCDQHCRSGRKPNSVDSSLGIFSLCNYLDICSPLEYGNWYALQIHITNHTE